MTIPEKSTPPTGKVEGGAKKLNQYSTDRSRYFVPRQDRVAVIKAELTLRQVIAECGIIVPAVNDVKFSSPFRLDRTPSCVIHGERMKDWGGEQKSWDLIDFYAEHHGIPAAQAIATLYARVSRDVAEKTTLERCFRKTDHESRDPLKSAKTDAAERKQRRATWDTRLRPLSNNEAQLVALSRNISFEAVARAISQKALYGLDTLYGTAWVLTNDINTIAQARLLNGKPWRDANNSKAKTLPGSFAVHPIMGELETHHAIALVEGGPDFLSVYHHAIASGVEELVCPVMMCGASLRIPDYYLTLFAGHRVRIFVHTDESGRGAATRWAQQLQAVGCFVDGFDFSGLLQVDGKPVKDLNDLCRVHPDCWEDNHFLIENAFSFATEES